MQRGRWQPPDRGVSGEEEELVMGAAKKAKHKAKAAKGKTKKVLNGLNTRAESQECCGITVPRAEGFEDQQDRAPVTARPRQRSKPRGSSRMLSTVSRIRWPR
jgi:hypothetical protein